MEWLRGAASPNAGERGKAAKYWRAAAVCLLAAPLACAEEAPSVVRIPGLATDTPGGLSPVIDLPFSGSGGGSSAFGGASPGVGGGPVVGGSAGSGGMVGGSPPVGGSVGGSPCEVMGSAGDASLDVNGGEGGAASTGGGCVADLGGAGG